MRNICTLNFICTVKISHKCITRTALHCHEMHPHSKTMIKCKTAAAAIRKKKENEIEKQLTKKNTAANKKQKAQKVYSIFREISFYRASVPKYSVKESARLCDAIERMKGI